MDIPTSSSSGIETDVEETHRHRRRRRRAYHNILRLMVELDSHEELFESLFGLSRIDFERLQSMISGDIARNHTQFRHMNPIRSRDRLGICLRFLTSGSSFQSLGVSYNMQSAIIETIVLEVCDSILHYLQSLVMPRPTKAMWKKIAAGFKGRYQMPNCIGSLNGRFVTVMGKIDHILLSLVDSDEKFVMIDLGNYGTKASKIWDNSRMGALFARNEFDIPEDQSPGFGTDELPFVIVGGNSFVIKPYLISKYRSNALADTDANKVFNCRIDPVKLTAEAAVTRLRRRWQIVQSNIPLPVPMAKRVITTACCLENYFGSPNI
ncbi:unnamed protein product [Arctia plantaginis]|uniref:DDE Tnp4 domain-containing protein n=1 Tax=Arctia plantaginis TaxID=874455 RepID=A0A8S1BAH3_ARCPL|nr:unnamed protein product [Arctia plantaginis]